MVWFEIRLSRYFLYFGLFLNLVHLSHEGETEDNLCSNIQEHFQLQGVKISNPERHLEGPLSRLCPDPLGCCSDDILDQLSNITMGEYQGKVERLIISMKSTLNKKHKKFDEFFVQLISNARTTLDNMFIDTYGSLYSVNSDVFVQLFRDLKAYYQGSVLDVGEVFESFFTEVMQKVFELIHPDFIFTDEYKQCIADNMDTIKPFAATPDTLTLQFRRSFVAARTFVRGLEGGKIFTGGVSKFRPSPRCVDELVSMTHCAACQGGTVVKPCTPLCMKVVRGCLVDYKDLSHVWESYIGGLRQLLNRLDGPFNIEAVLEPFEVKLSEAVMMLQDNQQGIDDAVFRECGEPKSRGNSTGFGKFGGFADTSMQHLDPSYLKSFPEVPSRKRRSAKTKETHGRKRRKKRKRRRNRNKKMSEIRIPHEHRLLPNIEETRYRYNKETDEFDREKVVAAKTALGTNLATLVSQMRRTLGAYEHHWRELPQQVCDGVAEPSATCWNGESMGNHAAVDDEMEEPNKEENHVTQPHLLRHRKKLNEVVSQLKQGYKGVDPQSPPSDDEGAFYSGSGGPVENLDEPGFDDPMKEEEDKQLKNNAKNLNEPGFDDPMKEGEGVELENPAEPTTEKPKICPGCGGTAATSSSFLLIGCSLLLALVT